ncbi:uncharacterized protein LOC143293646 [Babylonia areolata]|uniref:uncharacterized protein LOC143293646 n=1 Tax=Babylonia areolata TaxID=304850 RepID=UPI003FCF232D
MTQRSRTSSTALAETRRSHHHHHHFLLLPTLLTLGLLAGVAEAQRQRCPDECSCVLNFVHCYQFTELSLRQLPTTADTVVLTGGEVASFPPGFASRFPQLIMLEVQSTRVETVLNGTFAGLQGMDQIALTDCQLGTIEAGAFRDISNVLQVRLSGSEIGTVRSGAFSGLSNIGEFSVWSTKMERVESGAFAGFSNVSSFAFYLNNVTGWSRDAFMRMERLGKVDVYMNKFFSARQSAVMALQEATSDMNMYSNTFPCNCGIYRDFNAPLLKRYRVSQKCTEDGQVFRLSDLNEDETCNGQSSSSSTSFSSPPSTSSSTFSSTMMTTSASTPSPTTLTFRTTTPLKVTKTVYITTSPTEEGGSELRPSQRTSTPLSGSSSATATDLPSTATGQEGSTTVTQSGSGRTSGQTGDSANAGSGAAIHWAATQPAFVPLMTSVMAIAWLVSAS